MDEQTEQQPEQKKSKAWLWIVIIIVLLIIGAGIWFSLSGGSLPAGISSGGSSIPQPPALPSG